MPFFRKQASIIAIFVCYLLLTACDETKVVQCNKLIQVVNKGNAQIDSNKDNTDVKTTKNHFTEPTVGCHAYSDCMQQKL